MQKSVPSSTTTRQTVSNSGTKTNSTSKVKFGSVVISSDKPSKERVTANVTRSSEALERVAKNLLKPGVNLRAKKGVPQYSAVEGRPGVFLRRLDGMIARGQMIDGAFKEID